MSMADRARRRYAELYRSELHQPAGSALVDSLLERRAPMLLRLAMVLALADRQWLIEEQHIDAGAAWVRYATDSACFVFSAARNRTLSARVEKAAERISQYLATHGSASREQLMVDCFGRHQSAAVVDAAVAHLVTSLPRRFSVEHHPRAHLHPGRRLTVYRLDGGEVGR
jgi:putative DNA primase/helicase